LGFSNVYTQATSIREPALDWPSVNELWIDIMGGSGSNPNPDEDLPSALRFLAEETEAGTQGYILIVEDNESDVFLIRKAIEKTKLPVTLHVVKDGLQAMRFFDQADSNPAAPCPTLVLLDINLPRKQGGEVLKYMRNSRKCGKALVIAVSSSDSPRDREEMMKLGAGGYFRKPSEYKDFMKLGDLVKALLLPSL
jgi:chemotaxis family two-component system response regulator Rcp1